jgi:hypothetical protein
MKNFDIQIIESKKTSNNKIVRKTIRFKAKNGNKMTLKDVEKYYEYLVNEKNMNPYDISISGQSDLYRTIKSFNDYDLKPWGDIEYYQDKPSKKSLAKILNEYFYVDFYFRK